MLSILQPTFLILIGIAHHPLNAFGGTTPEDSSISQHSKIVGKFQNEKELMRKEMENMRRFSGFIFIEPQQTQFDNSLNDGRSEKEMISSSIQTVNQDHVIETPSDLRNYDEHFNCLRNCSSIEGLSRSCDEALSANDLNEGVYLLKEPKSDSKPFYVYCTYGDKSEQGWMVIQRRQDGSVNFNRGWLDYKLGFGDLNGEYWIGLERLHQITSSKPHELLIFLYTFEKNKGYAKYSEFVVGSGRENYKLTVGGYSGNIGDALKQTNSLKFATLDMTYGRDPNQHCVNAHVLNGGWWWMDGWCMESNLNGGYNSLRSSKLYWGLGDFYEKSLHKVFMAIRPK